MGENEQNDGNEMKAVELFNEASNRYQNAAKEATTDSYRAFTYFWTGNSQVKLMDYQEAVEFFQIAVDLDPSEEEYRNALEKYMPYVQETGQNESN